MWCDMSLIPRLMGTPSVICSPTSVLGWVAWVIAVPPVQPLSVPAWSRCHCCMDDCGLCVSRFARFPDILLCSNDGCWHLFERCSLAWIIFLFAAACAQRVMLFEGLTSWFGRVSVLVMHPKYQCLCCTSRVLVEGKSSVCLICMTYRVII